MARYPVLSLELQFVVPMGRKKELSDSHKSNILLLNNEGYSQREIANRLGISLGSINKFVNLARNGLSLKTKLRKGRPRKTSSRTDKAMKRLVQRKPFLSSAQIKSSLPGLLCDVSNRTIRHRLNKELGMKARRPLRKPLLTAKMRQRRLQFCEKHRYWTEQQWAKVIFSDEAKFQLFGNFNSTVRRPVNSSPLSPQFVTPTVKHPPSVMVWGSFSAGGRAGLHFLPKNTTLNSDKYIDILENHLLPFMEIRQCEIFQQDSAPAPTSRRVKNWFADHDIPLLDWPGNSPDLNPIENMWMILKRRISERNCASIEELKRILTNIWVTEITPEMCQRLASSMPRRIEAVIKNKGNSTKY